MILNLVKDQHGWRFEPHGEEPIAWYCNAAGGDVMRAAGWRPYEMPRVSDHVYQRLVGAGFLRVLYDISQPKLLELRGVELKLPVGGDHADQATLHRNPGRLLTQPV
jgi:hypothetical protein